MRFHPITLALQFLSERRAIDEAPFDGRPLFADNRAAINLLQIATGANFGGDVSRWKQWLRRYPFLYRSCLDDPRLGAKRCRHCGGRGSVVEQGVFGRRTQSHHVSCPECFGRGIVRADTPALIVDFLEMYRAERSQPSHG